MDLPLEQQWIERGAEVVHHRIVHDLQRAGVGIDLELADMATVGEGVGRRRAGERVVQAWRLTLRDMTGVPGCLRHLEQTHRAVGADDCEGAVGIVDVGGGGFQGTGRHQLALGDDLVGDAQGCRACDRDHAAAARNALGHDVGIALHEADAIGIDAEAGRGDLADRGLLALAVALVADDDRHRVVVVEACDGRFG